MSVLFRLPVSNYMLETKNKSQKLLLIPFEVLLNIVKSLSFPFFQFFFTLSSSHLQSNFLLFLPFFISLLPPLAHIVPLFSSLHHAVYLIGAFGVFHPVASGSFSVSPCLLHSFLPDFFPFILFDSPTSFIKRCSFDLFFSSFSNSFKPCLSSCATLIFFFS